MIFLNKFLDSCSKKKLFILIVGLFVVVFVLQQWLFVERSIGNSYFKYKNITLVLLHLLSSEMEMDSADLYLWDEKAFSLVRKYSLSPTVASRLYAYLVTAEKDAAELSYELKGGYYGTFDSVAGRLLCRIFPYDCPFIKAGMTEDLYSKELAEIVVQMVDKRIAIDGGEENIYPQNTISHPKHGYYDRPEGETYWDAVNPVSPEAGLWKTWLISDVSEFRAPPPPIYGSAEDFKEVTKVKNALVNLTDKEAEAVQYWAMGPGTETPAGLWLKKLTHLAKGEPNISLPYLLEVRGTLMQSIADACIVVWDTKYTDWTKRPYMRDLEIQTLRTSKITPYVPTPNFPSYISGHSTMSATAATILSFFFPEHKSYFFSEAEEAMHSRLWGGIHFDIDDLTGFGIGEKIGHVILSKKSGGLLGD